MYGPVRTVVWQGSAGDRRPYADLVGHSEVGARNEERRSRRMSLPIFLVQTDPLPRKTHYPKRTRTKPRISTPSITICQEVQCRSAAKGRLRAALQREVGESRQSPASVSAPKHIQINRTESPIGVYVRWGTMLGASCARYGRRPWQVTQLLCAPSD